jgi:transposase-like protein
METNTTAELVDDELKRDTRGRRIAEPGRRAEIVAGYPSSGLTQKAYARREGVNYHTFVSWLGQSRRPAALPGPRSEPRAPAPRFAQLTWPPTTSTAPTASRLEVVLPDGITLRGDDPAALLILLRALAPRRPC